MQSVVRQETKRTLSCKFPELHMAGYAVLLAQVGALEGPETYIISFRGHEGP